MAENPKHLTEDLTNQMDEDVEEGEEIYLPQEGDEFVIVDDSQKADVDSDMEDAGNSLCSTAIAELIHEEEGEKGEDTRTMEGEQHEIETEDLDMQDDSFQAFFGHADSVFTVAIHPQNSEIAASGGGDDKAFIWKTTTGEKLFELSGHKDSITSIKFNFDGQMIATGCCDGTVGIWETDTGKLVRTLEGPGADIEWVRWHPKGNVILAGSRDNSCWMWLAANGAFMNMFSGHNGPITCGDFSPDGKLVVTGSEDATVKVWDPKSKGGNASISIQGHNFHTDAITCMHISSSNLIATGSQDNTAKISNLSTGKVLGNLAQHTDFVETVAFSSSLNLIATGSLDKTINVWDINTMQLRTTCTHDDGVVKVVWHPSQPLIFSCSLDRTVRLWDGRNAKCEKVWKGHKDGILDLGLSKYHRLFANKTDRSQREGNIIVSGSDDHTALVFKL